MDVLGYNALFISELLLWLCSLNDVLFCAFFFFYLVLLDVLSSCFEEGLDISLLNDRNKEFCTPRIMSVYILQKQVLEGEGNFHWDHSVQWGAGRFNPLLRKCHLDEYHLMHTPQLALGNILHWEVLLFP